MKHRKLLSDEIAFESTAGSALYLIVAQTKPAVDATVNQPTPRP